MEGENSLMNILEVEDLCKSYSGFQLKNISFALPKGYIAGYVGRNGAGKTTTLNLITGLSRAERGSVRINGTTYAENPVAYKEAIGYIGDESYFPKELKVKDIRMILGMNYPTFQSGEFDRLIEKWKLPTNKKLAEFSRGMKVKLMFASVLSRETKILILDEATNGLDPAMREEVLRILQDYIEDGEKSILFSTHVLSDLEQIADYILFIDNGKLQLTEAKDDLLDQYLLVKGNRQELKCGMEKKLIGCKDGEFGFEAMIAADDAAGFGNGFVFDKPNIDQIVLHFIRNGGVDRAGL